MSDYWRPYEKFVPEELHTQSKVETYTVEGYNSLFCGKDLANLQKRYRNLLTRGEKELPPIPPKPSGKRGKIAKSDAHNLWERLKLHEASVLLFAKDSLVAFTNNRAEQDLRMAKVKQKSRGVLGLKYVLRLIVAYQATCKRWRAKALIL